MTVSTVGEKVRAYVPDPLPPDPPLKLDNIDFDLFERANRALGRLDSLASLLPDPHLFLYQYVRKEAVLSSQIEGTQSSLSELLFEDEETPGVPLDDVQEVSNYVAAMEYGLERLRGGFPLSLRLIREIHGVLLREGRGAEKTPGEFRTTQNWIAGTRPGNALFVPPPPPERVLECMGAWEKFLHGDPEPTPTLVKAALAHVQFETIHPFLDRNGRLWRLVITLLLCVERALEQPLLYLSLYLKTHRAEYYDWLQRVRLQGDWEGWLRFFVTGVLETADQATRSAKQLLALFDTDRKRIGKLGRAAASPLRVHELLERHPLVSARRASRELALSPPTVNAALESLVKLGIVRETTGRQRGRLFAYDRYLKVLQEGTEPLPRRSPMTTEVSS